ncbi:MAG: hypothetical protein O9292_01415 [Rhodobacteraceae bacterium]|jgi:hypothetical protein|nr:hypothetical protein [Paracoccaceae bacterium]
MPAVAVIILQKAERISELLEERVGVKSASLETGLRHARPHLPQEARAAGQRMAVAARLAQRGGIVDVDAHRFDDDYRVLLRHIQSITPGAKPNSFSLRQFLMGGATALASGALLGVGLTYAGLI